MVKLLFVLMNEYRLWALPQALAALERRYPGAVEGRVYSVREINADAGLERALLADGAAADMAFLASHGSIQNLYCFSRLWEALEGRPVYFTSTMGDELAELLPRLGLEPALYAALDSYYQAGSPGDLEGLVLCALNGRFGGDYPLSPPSPPRGQGVYTLEGFLPPEREAGYRTRMAAETRPVIGVLIHDHYARTGNLEHVDALLRAIQARGGVPYALSDSFAADHGTEQGILYRMERFYRRADGTPIPGALVVSYGFSLTTLAGREARAGQVPASVFENWGLPVIQGLTTYFSADEYRRDIRGLDLVSLPVCVYQPEFDGQLISVPYAVTERTADGRKVCLPLPDRVTRVAELACRWVDEVFGADVVLHVGTHGTLEWLPGKEIGLSSGCFGDICIGGVPHLYIYNISILGEGMQAKRRSYACILDHLIPSMDDADTYGGLTDLDEAIDGYYHARQARPAQVPALLERIFTLAEELEVTADLQMERADLEAEPEDGVARLHRWMSRIKTSLVRDGLHIYGQPPEGERFDHLARALVRVPNGAVPALEDSILLAQGWAPEELRAAPERLYPDGRTALRIVDGAIATARRLFARLSAEGYRPEAAAELLAEEGFPGDTTPLARVLDFVCTQAAPRLRQTTDELDLLLAGVEGRFVPPLPGGSPSRGNAHILPTGRNFYAIDPAAVPSRAAWTVGQALAEQAVDAYRAQKGEPWPESVAIVVYSDECMKTNGEDIAEVFALMGVRPRYLGQTDKVVGVEPIPLAELGRPRIDAVLRISGLFRDTFPNVVELVERAVLAVAGLDEPQEQNFVKKHTDQERERLVAEGLSENEALEQASLRVFGCPPGTYGAGVSKAIHSQNWESWRDLSQVYTLWSAHGYSSRFHGQAMPELFRSQLSSVGMTIKNESSVEIDMLDSDDFYSYHGGLIACVRDCSGQRPVSVAGLTADPARPETARVETELARVMRSRILNPKWLEGLKRHGYKGAQELSTTFDTFFGWDAAAEVASNWMYDAMARQFLLDEETRRWMEQVNDAAVLQMSERFLEAHQRGMWQAGEEELRAIRRIYMDMEGVMEDGFQ